MHFISTVLGLYRGAAIPTNTAARTRWIIFHRLSPAGVTGDILDIFKEWGGDSFCHTIFLSGKCWVCWWHMSRCRFSLEVFSLPVLAAVRISAMAAFRYFELRQVEHISIKSQKQSENPSAVWNSFVSPTGLSIRSRPTNLHSYADDRCFHASSSMIYLWKIIWA